MYLKTHSIDKTNLTDLEFLVHIMFDIPHRKNVVFMYLVRVVSISETPLSYIKCIVAKRMLLRTF